MPISMSAIQAADHASRELRRGLAAFCRFAVFIFWAPVFWGFFLGGGGVELNRCSGAKVHGAKSIQPASADRCCYSSSFSAGQELNWSLFNPRIAVHIIYRDDCCLNSHLCRIFCPDGAGSLVCTCSNIPRCNCGINGRTPSPHRSPTDTH